MKEYILNLVRDKVAQLCYYDRKEDEEGCTREAWDEALADGTVTIDELVAVFRKELETRYPK